MNSNTNSNCDLHLDAALNTADPVPLERCRTCQRWGLPILPLRAAYAPEPWHTQALPVSRGSEVTALRMLPDQPRILRQGFLYVLLDRTYWQSYQITPEGVLRQFPAFQIPREEPVPLSELCIGEDHDIPAAFLNINTHRYSTAWLAIANDPWPKEVLHAYKRGGVVDGMNLDERFYKLDLKVARDDPASIGIAMTETDLQLHQVLEYAQPNAGDFRSVHGFYPRNHRLRAMAGHVRTVTKEYQLSKGVLALVLPDPLGVVQEMNNQRLLRYQAMQEWMAEPERCFEHFTSQTLLGIRQFQVSKARARAIEEAKAAVKAREEYNDSPQSYRTPLPALDLEQEKEHQSTEAMGDARKRLDERYNEKERKTFQDKYDKTLAAWQKIVDDVAEPYASHHDSAAFRLAALHDYDCQVTQSHDGFVCMLAMCQTGGVTEPITASRFGATRSLWLEQLEDQDSLFHKAMRDRDKTGPEQFAHDLAGDEQTRVFHGAKTLIGAMEGDRGIANAVSQLLSAAAIASNALGEQLSEKSRTLLLDLHRKAWLRYHGVETTRITVPLKVGEYLTLLNKVLYEGVERYATKVDQQFRKPAERKVRAMLLNNYFAPALASSHARLIEVVVWTTESAESLKARLDRLGSGLGDGLDDALRSVNIDGYAFKAGMKDFAHRLSLSAEDARLLAGDAMRSMRNPVSFNGTGVVNMAMSLGSLYFQHDALRRSHENMLTAVGDEHDEAVLAVLSASVGVMGAGVEIVGGVIQTLLPDLKVSVRSAGRMVPVELGGRILQFGGAIVSVATAVEGLQYALAAGRTGEVGDKAASDTYNRAAIVSAVSAVFGVAGSVWGTSMLLGPLAIAVFLGFVAFGLAVRAKRLESQPLEFWARHSRWGLPVEHRRWLKSDEMDTAIGALNAALLGLDADLEVTYIVHRPTPEVVADGGSIKYRIVLPGYSADASRYEWALRTYRPGDSSGVIIAGGRNDGTDETPSTSVSGAEPGDEPQRSVPIIHHDTASKTLTIWRELVYSGTPNFHAVKLEVAYWPDKSDESGVARLTVVEDKFSKRVKASTL
ncbi:MAG: T6SS effector BTH_I2691 family protein [Pseudomonas sp.]|uniref:T6SS effector BTH_I2691 family protein n=1 Tax=Pseudomonas sp. TaxID=306 RepID=UPI003D104FA7